MVDDSDIEAALEFADGDLDMAAEVLAGRCGVDEGGAERAIEEYCNR